MEEKNIEILKKGYRPLVYFADKETFYVGKIDSSHYELIERKRLDLRNKVCMIKNYIIRYVIDNDVYLDRHRSDIKDYTNAIKKISESNYNCIYILDRKTGTVSNAINWSLTDKKRWEVKNATVCRNKT